MARVLVQSTNYVPGLVSGLSHGQPNKPKGSAKAAKSTTTVKTMCSRSSLQVAPGLGMRGAFSGLQGLNALDTALTPSWRRRRRHCQRDATTTTRGVVPKASMFELYTEKAMNVIMQAQKEARRLGHNYVGTEQILLGLIVEGTGIAAKVLKGAMGINLEEARLEVEKIIGRGSGFVAVEIPFTLRAKRALLLSLEEACQLGHNDIGTEHLLLGLLHEGTGSTAACVLENLGADPSDIRTQVIIHMVGQGESTEAVGASVGGGSSGKNKMPITLEEDGTNLTN